MDVEALTVLAAKVEAGDTIWIAGAIEDSFGTFGPPGEGNSWMAYKAHNGDLNAAKSLHDAVLPGWAVDELSQNGMTVGHPWGVRLAKWEPRKPDGNKKSSAGWGCETHDMNPARAWLLAILRALIAQAPATSSQEGE